MTGAQSARECATTACPATHPRHPDNGAQRPDAAQETGTLVNVIRSQMRWNPDLPVAPWTWLDARAT